MYDGDGSSKKNLHDDDGDYFDTASERERERNN